jgi:hypothetical protein
MIFDIDAYNTVSISFSAKEAVSLIRMIESAALPERRTFHSLKVELQEIFK